MEAAFVVPPDGSTEPSSRGSARGAQAEGFAKVLPPGSCWLEARDGLQWRVSSTATSLLFNCPTSNNAFLHRA